jgi:hypothetical protein
MASLPTGSDEVVKFAVPPLSERVNGLPAAVTLTVPVGVPAPGDIAVTVITNVVGWPNTFVGVVVVIVVKVFALLTVWVTVSALLVKLLSPL